MAQAFGVPAFPVDTHIHRIARNLGLTARADASWATAAAFLARAAAAGVPAVRLGTAGGDRLIVEGVLDLALAALREAHEGWLPRYMAGDGTRVAAE